MIHIDEYRTDPCRKLSIPYWKAQQIHLPNNMKIVHAQDFQEQDKDHYTDEPYFRLKHDLQKILSVKLPCGYHLCDANSSNFATHINSCYENIGITKEELDTYTQRKVYAPSLWLAVKDTTADRIVASAIAELDRDCKEGVLEWIQVSEDHRHRGLGTFIVSELLWRMKGIAQFATVSGRCNDSKCPEALYRKCGFYGNDVWHVLTRK